MKKLKKILLPLILGLCMVFAVPSIVPSSVSVLTVQAARVKLNKNQSTLIKGQTLQLKLQGISKKEKISWISSKKSIATVSQKGKVTAKRKGTATITAKVGKKKYNCKITVEAPSISKKQPIFQ